VTRFIDGHKENRSGGLRWGVEPICDTLQVAPQTYYTARKRPLSPRAIRDAVMIPILVALWTTNRKVYGARKLWKAALRAGHDIGRDQVARLMAQAGIRGVTRRRAVRTTRPDPAAQRPPDLVGRHFEAEAPNRLWVVDLTYVATWAGTAYVCFLTDAFSRRIVGWRVASHMRATMVLDALEMARWTRNTRLEEHGVSQRAAAALLDPGKGENTGLVCHSDAGSQFTSIRWSERLAEAGATPSIGSVGDSYDNALAETVNGLYKAELIYGPDQGPWRSIEAVELATLSWVHWYNHQRLHGYCGDIPPAEYEEAYYAQAA